MSAISARRWVPRSQSAIVALLVVVLLVVFSAALPRFLSVSNLLGMLRNISVLGILGVAMGVTIIGRGIDLTVVASMAVSIAWAFTLVALGVALPWALLAGLAFCVVVGLVNGWLIAYVEIPAIFATLAMMSVIYGFGQLALFDAQVVYIPDSNRAILAIGQGRLLGIPVPVYCFVALCIAAQLLLSCTRVGRYIRAIGDNQAAARITGAPVRPVIVLQYVVAGVLSFLAAIIAAGSVGSMDTHIAASTLVYDVVLVAVIGGIGLSGGKGGMHNVVLGTLLVGILVNGLTILDLSYYVQNMIKGAVFIGALLVDTVINPRDEQTSQQGDI